MDIQGIHHKRDDSHHQTFLKIDGEWQLYLTVETHLLKDAGLLADYLDYITVLHNDLVKRAITKDISDLL